MNTQFLADDSKLKIFIEKLFEAKGMPSEHARQFADVLVLADLMGVVSHGSTRTSGYITMIDKGWINVQPKIQLISETETVAVLDGDNGAGAVAGIIAMNTAIAKCKNQGVSCVTLRQAGHTGMSGYFPLMAAKQGLISIWFNNAPRNVPAFGGITRLLGTNPLAISIPVGSYDPILLDMATTIVSMGQVRLAQKLGNKIPWFWGCDFAGNSTVDPNAVLNGGFLKWIGSYKGYGLALLIEALTSVLSGGKFGKETPPLEDFGTGPIISNAMAIVIDPSRFISAQSFADRMIELKTQLKGSKLAAGANEILLPGEMEFRLKRERENLGIPIGKVNWDELAKLAQGHKLDFAIEKVSKVSKAA